MRKFFKKEIQPVLKKLCYHWKSHIKNRCVFVTVNEAVNTNLSLDSRPLAAALDDAWERDGWQLLTVADSEGNGGRLRGGHSQVAFDNYFHALCGWLQRGSFDNKSFEFVRQRLSRSCWFCQTIHICKSRKRYLVFINSGGLSTDNEMINKTGR